MVTVMIKTKWAHASVWQQHVGVAVTHGQDIIYVLFFDLLVLCREELWLARKDSDHYLRTMFSYLMDTLHPDAVILLGDIFSDGFQASANQWQDYLTVRFNLSLKNLSPVGQGLV